MTLKPRTRLYAIDTQQISLFSGRFKQTLGIPESILEEYSLEKSTRLTKMTNDYPPLTQYKEAEGYEFTWGNILERRVNEFIVWDYCFNHLLSQYLQNGKRLSDMQRAAFSELEKAIDYTTRDIIPVLSMEHGWQFIPCSTVGAFTQVIHFTREEEARDWTIKHLLTTRLPEIVGKLMKDVSKAAGN
jgi:hypothetical protein